MKTEKPPLQKPTPGKIDFRWGAAGLALGLLLTLAAYAAGQALRPSPILRGAMLNPPVPAVDFSLSGPEMRAYSLRDFRGQAVLLSFTCQPCSQSQVVLDTLKQTLQSARQASLPVQVLLISLTPEEEPPQAFAAYAQSQDAGFLGLSGDRRVITDLAHNYDVYFAAGANGVESSPLIFLIDAQGFWRATYPARMSPQDILADLRTLAQEK